MEEQIKIDEKTIILASASPRRREILKKLGLPFIVKPQNIDETMEQGILPSKAVRDLAVKKLESAVQEAQKSLKSGKTSPRWILASDTIVVIDKEILGKPQSPAQAKEFMNKLSGKKHKVMTAIAFKDLKTGKMWAKTDISNITFINLTEETINWYISTGDWQGAAGGYQIQQHGETLVKKISGSYSSIMGLSISLLYGIFLQAGYPAYT